MVNCIIFGPKNVSNQSAMPSTTVWNWLCLASVVDTSLVLPRVAHSDILAVGNASSQEMRYAMCEVTQNVGA